MHAHEPSTRPPAEHATGPHGHGISLWQATKVWTYIGLNSFGGPTGQIAVMHKVLVEQRKWISDERFLHALNYCMVLPGPEAMQLATYVGWLLHRTRGGLIAGTLFVLPGFLSILVLSIAYTEYREFEVVGTVLYGLKAAVLAIVAEAVIRIGKRVLRNRLMYAIAGASFVAIFFFQVSFPLIIALAGLLGFLGDRIRPDLFEVIRFKSTSGDAHATYATDRIANANLQPRPAALLGTLSVWLTLWLAPVAALHLWLGGNNVFVSLAWFFSQAAVVTFGGAYAVLAYIAQQAVNVHGWLEPGEMMTGLGMAETTPGPLIQVVQFVGYMGAYREPGALSPVLAGVAASVLTTWVTFMPCFLWIFLGAPFVEQVRGKRSLSAALSTITAAVVGVVLNLAVWFALHALFARVDEERWLGARINVPDVTSVHWGAVFIAAVAAVLLFRFHWGVLRVLAAAVLLSLAGWCLTTLTR